MSNSFKPIKEVRKICRQRLKSGKANSYVHGILAEINTRRKSNPAWDKLEIEVDPQKVKLTQRELNGIKGLEKQALHYSEKKEAAE